MAHWAELDEYKKVIRVLFMDNDHKDGDEGYSWLTTVMGGTWVKTSYNAKENGFRKHFAGPGYEYREDLDAFVPPMPYPSWTLNEDVLWVPPVAYPDSGDFYTWGEDEQTWTRIDRNPNE